LQGEHEHGSRDREASSGKLTTTETLASGGKYCRHILESLGKSLESDNLRPADPQGTGVDPHVAWARTSAIEVEIPIGWKVVVDSRAVEPRRWMIFPAVAKALAKPTDGQPLTELAKDARNVVIVIDDVGRPTPSHLVLRSFLDALLGAASTRAGIKSFSRSALTDP